MFNILYNKVYNIRSTLNELILIIIELREIYEKKENNFS